MLNRKGFTLIEILAVVVILGVLAAIIVPSVNSLITKNKADSYQKLKNNIIIAAKNYFSDYRYEIVIDTSGSCNDKNQRIVKKVPDIVDDINSKLPISVLVKKDYIKQPIKNPMNSSKTLDLNNSYVTVWYSCQTKDYIFSIIDNEDDSELTWN